VITPPAAFDKWYSALEGRHLKELTFPEVRRALQALSSLYVERRASAGIDRALESPGKRAAFALFYAPLHLLQVHYVSSQLGAGSFPSTIVDLGCGTGSAGIGWALNGSPDFRPVVTGIDRNQWALGEARWNYDFFKLAGRTAKSDATRLTWSETGLGSRPGGVAGIVLAFTVNEIDERPRAVLLNRLLERGSGRRIVLVIEPLARWVSPWWTEWKEAFESAGGRGDEWRFAPEMPERLRLLDKAAGLNHQELTCKSLWLPAGGV